MDLTGRTLGKYKLIERLGQGGMAQVYKAIQPTIERTVAIKVLHSHLAESEDFVVRFKREARGLGLLQHPHIVHVIDFDVVDDTYFMVVDYIPGQTLRAYLDQRGALSYDEALALATQLADALAYAHRQGTIHRDIKPANALFKDADHTHVVLTDFGIGRLLDDATMTMSGSVIGTPAYMSPEAVMGQRVDGRADIYSLGTILYEMVTGRVPYTGNTPMSVIMKQVNEPLPSLHKLKPDMPPVLVHLIEKTLEKDPADRFQTADALLAAIRETQAALHTDQSITSYRTIVVPDRDQVGTPEPTSPPGQPADLLQTSLPPTQPAQADRLRRPLIALLGLLLMISLVATGLWYSTNRSNAGPVADAPTTATAPTTTATTRSEPSPTEAAVGAVATTAPEPTIAPTTEPTAAAIPLTIPGRMGELRFADSETTRARNFTLQLDRVVQPPAGSHYELWLQDADGSARNIGIVPVENNQLLFSGNLDVNLAGTTGSVLVTIEPDGSDNTQATAPGGQVIFTGQLDTAYATEMRQVLAEGNGVGFLIGAQEQSLIAIQHAQFSRDSLAQGDLAEAQRHAEHVINILDGENGDFFGDVNLDGQAQNPGDGFGVREYLEESRRHIEQAYASVSPSADRQYHIDSFITASDAALARLDAAIRSASSLAATDTPAEAQPFADTLQAEVDALMATQVEQETIVSAYQHALALAAIPLFAAQDDVPAPDALVDTIPGRVGTLRLSNSTALNNGSFLLQMGRVLPPPEGAHYDAWLVSESGQALFLGQLDVTSGYVDLVGTYTEDVLANYNRLVVSVETTAPNVVPSDTIVFEGDLLAGIGPDIISLFAEENDNGKGALFGAEEQLATAIQHRQFAQDALSAGDLAEAQRHIEHVVNILDGADGNHFGDLNFDGQAQNPGDGTGVRGHMLNLVNAVRRLQEATSFTGNQQFYASRVIAISSNSLNTNEAAIQQALKVFASDTPTEAQPFLDELGQLLEDLRAGSDLDGNGVIDHLTDEGGLLGVTATTLALHEVNIFPVTTAAVQ